MMHVVFFQTVLSTPAALITIICYAFNYHKLEKFLNTWKVCEQRHSFLQMKLEKFAHLARRLTQTSIVITAFYVTVISVVVVIHMGPPCNVGFLQALTAIGSANMKLWTSTFAEVSFVFFVMAVRAG